MTKCLARASVVGIGLAIIAVLATPPPLLVALAGGLLTRRLGARPSRGGPELPAPTA